MDKIPVTTSLVQSVSARAFLQHLIEHLRQSPDDELKIDGYLEQRPIQRLEGAINNGDTLHHFLEGVCQKLYPELALDEIRSNAAIAALALSGTPLETFTIRDEDFIGKVQEVLAPSDEQVAEMLNQIPDPPPKEPKEFKLSPRYSLKINPDDSPEDIARKVRHRTRQLTPAPKWQEPPSPTEINKAAETILERYLRRPGSGLVETREPPSDQGPKLIPFDDEPTEKEPAQPPPKDEHEPPIVMLPLPQGDISETDFDFDERLGGDPYGSNSPDYSPKTPPEPVKPNEPEPPIDVPINTDNSGLDYISP